MTPGFRPYSLAPFEVNGRTYHPPTRPVVVICMDGCGDEYLTKSMAHGRMPNVSKMAVEGYRGLVRGALPSFTNVNNCALVTGTPPSKTGIAGNYMLDPVTGQEVMTNSATYLRNETILAAAARAGRKAALVTAKDKLRELLSKNMQGIALSSEKTGLATLAGHGMDKVLSQVGPPPSIYSAEASLYVLRVGAALLAAGLADFVYLSLTDYIQHKYPPEAPAALDFYAALDREIGRLLGQGAIVGATADHGMNAKCDGRGNPKVIFLETQLTRQFGPGFRVICPITDPYVVHHGGLGSAVTVYVSDRCKVPEVSRWILALDGITEVYDRETAAAKLELPEDRIGDLFVLSGRDVVVGRTPAHHDLTRLEGTLRSHGGRHEEMVPMILSGPLTPEYTRKAAGDPRNFDIFDFTCNGVRI
jgi:phosphonoacetate hydrolase